jgi:hypothetical protein
MARAARRQSQLDQLAHENEELRSAARQLLAGLTEYAKKENWLHVPDEQPGAKAAICWIGPGDGPAIARKYLGLDQESN